MDGLTYTVKEFCQHSRISHAQFYELQKSGEGPKLTRIRSRTYVSQETAREWIRQREALSQGGDQAKS